MAMAGLAFSMIETETHMTRGSVLLLIVALLSPTAARAQWVDAQFPRKGEMLIGLAMNTTDVQRFFDFDGTKLPLSDLFSANLDSRLVPELSLLDNTLDSLFASLGLGAPDTSDLGTVNYDVLLERTRVPLTLTMGVTNLLAAFVEVPFVQGKSFVATVYDSLATGAGPGASAFGGDPDATFAALAAGIAQLEAIVAADTMAPDRQAAAEGLVTTARTLEAGLLDLRQLAYVSSDSSANGRRLTSFYESVRTGFGEFSVSLPALSLARALTADEAAALSSGPGFGIETPESRDTGIKLGDIEVGISLQPLNTFRERPGRERPTVPLRARLDALWRFPSGSRPAANRLGDVGTGDGQADLEFRAAFDVGFGRRFWLSLAGSYNIQLEAEIERLVTAPEAPIQPGGSTALVKWDPGDVATLIIVPRFNFTSVITFSGLFTLTHHGQDKVQSTGAGVVGNTFSPSDLERGTEYTARSLGFTIRYSATEWAGDRRPSLPVDVELRYLNTVSASDGLAPARIVWDVGLRYYLSVFR